MQYYKTKVDIVYDMILQKITEGEYQPGDRLIIRNVAIENHVSDIPVREAIRLLERDGYVQVHANQGAVVCEISKEKLSEIFQLRAVLEGYAARQSIDYLSSDDYKELRQINQKLKESISKKELPKQFSQLNMEFHLRMYSVLPQKMLYNMIVELWKKYSITKAVFSLVPGRGENSVEQHENILQLMEKKKYKEVEMLMREHKIQAGVAFCRQIEQREKEQGKKG